MLFWVVLFKNLVGKVWLFVKIWFVVIKVLFFCLIFWLIWLVIIDKVKIVSIVKVMVVLIIVNLLCLNLCENSFSVNLVYICLYFFVFFYCY